MTSLVDAIRDQRFFTVAYKSLGSAGALISVAALRFGNRPLDQAAHALDAVGLTGASRWLLEPLTSGLEACGVALLVLVGLVYLSATLAFLPDATSAALSTRTGASLWIGFALVVQLDGHFTWFAALAVLPTTAINVVVAIVRKDLASLTPIALLLASIVFGTLYLPVAFALWAVSDSNQPTETDRAKTFARAFVTAQREAEARRDSVPKPVPISTPTNHAPMQRPQRTGRSVGPPQSGPSLWDEGKP